MFISVRFKKRLSDVVRSAFAGEQIVISNDLFVCPDVLAKSMLFKKQQSVNPECLQVLKAEEKYCSNHLHAAIICNQS